MKKVNILILTVLFLLITALFSAVFADDGITPGYLYRPEKDPAIPQKLYVGWIKECGRFSIRILQQPILTKSTNYMVADADTMYLTVRVAITNKSSESAGWLAADSFILQDTYYGRIYGTYKLDVPISAKSAQGFKTPVFFSEIKPGDTLNTVLVFEVYPDVESYIMTFSPRAMTEASPEDTVSFVLPYAEMTLE